MGQKILIERVAETRCVSIPAGEVNSNSFVLSGFVFGSFQMPAGFDGAAVTLQVTNVQLFEGKIPTDRPDPSTFVDAIDYEANASGGAHPPIAVAAGGGAYLWAEASAFKWGRFVSDVEQVKEISIPVSLIS